MQRLVTEVRRFRSDQGLADRQKVPARLSGIDEADLSAQVAAVTTLAWLTAPGAEFRPTASHGGAAGLQHEPNGRRRTRHLGHHRRRRRAPPARKGFGRGAKGAGRHHSQTRQRGLPGQGARRRRRQDPRPATGGAPRKSSGSRPDWLRCNEFDESRPGRLGADDARGAHPRRDRIAAAGRAPAGPALAGDEDRAQPDPDQRPDGPARLAATELPVDPHRRHQRQDLGGTDGRRAGDRVGPTHRPDHQPAPAVGGRTHLDRRPADQPGPVRGDVPRDRAVRADDRPSSHRPPAGRR